MIITGCGDIGKAIRKRRKALGYTQADISELTGVSVSFLSDLENGKPTIELEKALFIMHILGMDMILQERGEL